LARAIEFETEQASQARAIIELSSHRPQKHALAPQRRQAD